jgi:hypothetical protein
MLLTLTIDHHRMDDQYLTSQCYVRSGVQNKNLNDFCYGRCGLVLGKLPTGLSLE